jgi:hypothetical protein
MPAIACSSVLMLAGCGGASPSVTTGTGASASGGDGPFFAEANAICREAQETGSALAPARNESELARFLERELMLGRDEVNKLSALHPPSDKAAAYRIWLSSLNQTLGELGATVVAAKARKTEEVEALVREAGGFNERDLTRGKEVGLTTCAKEG